MWSVMNTIMIRISATVLISIVTVLSTMSGQALGTNANLSFWTRNLSEGTVEEQTGFRDFSPEIVAVGSTVHVMWITHDPGSSVYTVYYKRSVDAGKTWDPKQAIFTYSDISQSVTYSPASEPYKRMAVVADTVHVAINHYGHNQEKGWFGVLSYIRSSNNGLSFDPPQDLFSADAAWHVHDIYVSASDGEVSVGLRHQRNGKADNSYIVLNSSDGGNTFSRKVVYTTTTGAEWRVWDMKRYQDCIYVLYSNSKFSSGSFYSNLFLSSSSDGGNTFIRKLISVPSKDGKHKSHFLHDVHYAPKIAASGSNVYVTWAGYDHEDKTRVFLRRSSDCGEHFSPAIALSEALPEGVNPRPGQETIAAKGDHVYIVFLSNDGSVFFKRSADAGVTFGALQTLTAPTGVHWIDKGSRPLIKLKASDQTGRQVFVLWNRPTYVYSTNGGKSFSTPVLLSTHFTSGNVEKPQMAVGKDGAVHWVAEAGFHSNGTLGDYDIFYRRHEAAAPEPKADNLALRTRTNATVGKSDTVQVPPSAHTSFTSRMTLELWVKPLEGGRTMGTTSADKLIVHKRETRDPFSGYALGTTRALEGRNPLACIKTTSGTFFLDPGYYDSKHLIPHKAWTHLAMTYDADAAGNNFKLYKNGNLILSTRATGTITSAKGLLLVGFHGNWVVDELRLWRKVRTQRQIRNNMNRSLEGNERGLTAYYPLDGTTRDMTGHGNDGVLMYKEAFVAGKPFP